MEPETRTNNFPVVPVVLKAFDYGCTGGAEHLEHAQFSKQGQGNFRNSLDSCLDWSGGTNYQWRDAEFYEPEAGGCSCDACATDQHTEVRSLHCAHLLLVVFFGLFIFFLRGTEGKNVTPSERAASLRA